MEMESAGREWEGERKGGDCEGRKVREKGHARGREKLKGEEAEDVRRGKGGRRDSQTESKGERC